MPQSKLISSQENSLFIKKSKAKDALGHTVHGMYSNNRIRSAVRQELEKRWERIQSQGKRSNSGDKKPVSGSAQRDIVAIDSERLVQRVTAGSVTVAARHCR